MVLVVLLAFLWGRGRHVWYWLDEGLSVGIASHPLGEIPGLLRQDGAPPLYYVLLHGWMRLFGSSEPSTHILSLLPGLAAVPVAFWGGRGLFGRRAGWMAAALVALNPFLGYYVNETRMYSLVVLLSLVASICFLHAFVFRRRRYLAGFAVSLALLLYTHNWALFYSLGAGVAFLGCVALERDRAERRRTFLDGVLAFGAATVLYLPWLPTLLYQIGHTGAPFSRRPTLKLVRSDLITLLGPPEVVVALGLGSGAAFVALVQRRPWTRIAIAVLAGATLVVVAAGTAWVLSRDESVWVGRYLAVLVGPLLVVLAAGLARGGGAAVAAVAVAAFLVGPIEIKGQLFDKSNAREVAERLGPRLAPGDLVVTDYGRSAVMAYYLQPGLRWAETNGLLPDERVSDQREGARQLREGDPRVRVKPLLDEVGDGGRVLLICPPKSTLDSDAPIFVELIVGRCYETLELIGDDPRFRLEELATSDEEIVAPVDGFLFVKTGA